MNTPEWITRLINRLDEVDEQTWFGSVYDKWFIVEWSPREGEPVDEGWWTVIEFKEIDLLSPEDHTISLLLLTLFKYAAKSYLSKEGWWR